MKNQFQFLIKLIEKLKGNDVLCLMRDLLSEIEIPQAQPCHLKALSLYSHLFNESKAKEKLKYLRPIKLSGISFRKAKFLGFKTTAYMWTNCLMNYSRKKGILNNLIRIISN